MVCRLTDLNNRESVVDFLAQEVRSIKGAAAANVSENTPLIGAGTALTSRDLVELLVALEEFCEERLHVHFDWTSDSAMSESRSVFRTVGSLADHIASLSAS